jgi:hypothetical protein
LGLRSGVGVAFDVVAGRRDEPSRTAGVDRGGIADHLAGVTFTVVNARRKTRRKNRLAAFASRRADTTTSMIWSC